MSRDDDWWDAVGKNDWREEQAEADYVSVIDKAVLAAIQSGAQTSREIYTVARKFGLPFNHKNIFPAFERLERRGKIKKKYATRPIQWMPCKEPTAIPEEQLPTGLMLMMGYTNIEPVGGHKVSPLEIYEEHDYKEMSNDTMAPDAGKFPSAVPYLD